MEDHKTTGLTENVTQLCQLHLRGRKRAYFVQPDQSKDTLRKKLRKTLYDVLFGYLKKPPRHRTGGAEIIGCKQRILAHALKLRCERKFDDASRLEDLLDKLDIYKDDAVSTMLEFLGHLIDSSQTEDTLAIGQHTHRLPHVFDYKNSPVLLPTGPPVYGDSCVVKAGCPFYMHYPRHLFEVGGINPDLHLNRVCDLTPGHGLSGKGFFSVQGNLNDTYETETRSTLFGALLQSKVCSLDVRLDIPEVAHENKMFDIKIPKKFQELDEDEGFMSTSQLLSSVDSFHELGTQEDDIWDRAARYIPSKHYTWETIGLVPGPTERPYLPDAGPKAVAEIYDQWQRELQILGADTHLLQTVEISPAQLVKDVINLLIGIPSKSFHLHQDDDELVLRTGVSVSGLMPHSVSHFLEDLIQCGSQYYRLCNFARAPVLDSFYKKGLVYQAFCGGIRKYLQRYRAAVLSLPCDKTLLEVKLLCVRISEQIRFVANLCKCEKSIKVTVESSTEHKEFPKGVMLLSYVYRETLTSLNSDHYPLMLSILHTTLTPYCLFVQDWVYHGTYRDVYGEFMFKVNTDYLQYRDKRYWTQGYSLKSTAAEENVPVFLSHLASEIFTCGKALNLLKLCNPKHFLCNLDEREIPQVMISFSDEDLSSLRNRCEVYVSRMQQISKQVIMSRDEAKRRAEQAKIELLERAKEASMKDVARFQAKVLAYRTAVDVKKRKEFQDLKDHMEQDLKRRAKEKAEEKAGDKLIMDKLTRKEELMDRREAELELQARAELIEMYSKMTEEAAHRERKALWRIERAKLASARLEFLVEQEVAWRKELKEAYQIMERGEREMTAGDSQDGGELPHWAERLGEDQTVIISGKTPEETLSSGEPGKILSANVEKSTLPMWAQKKLGRSNLPSLQVKTDDLPVWALKGLKTDAEDYSGVVVVAGDSATPEGGLLIFPEESQKGMSEKEPEPKNSKDVLVNSKISASDDNEGAKDSALEKHEIDLPSSSTDEVSHFPVLEKPSHESEGSGFDSKHEVSEDALSTESTEQTQLETKRKYGYSPSKWRTKVKVIGEITAETTPHAEKPQIHIVGNRHASVESESSADAIPSLRHVPNCQISTETEQNDVQKSTIHINPNFCSTTESTAEEIKPQIRTFGETVNAESEGSTEGLIVPHLRRPEGKHVSQQSAPEKEKSKKASIYGHISQLSNMEFVISAPKLKRQEWRHVGMEADFKNFAIKPNIRLSKRMSATTQTAESVSRPGIKISGRMHATKESEFVDVDAERMSRFKKRNLYGHSSDSTVQKLLYGEKFGTVDSVDGDIEDSDQEVDPQKLSLILKSIPAEAYPDNFDFLDDNPCVDLVSTVLGGRGRFGNYGNQTIDFVEYYHYNPLSVLLKKSITIPLLAQISLVNDCVLGYFNCDLKIEEHFQALRRYLLMGDGDFSQILSDMLFEKLSVSARPKEILNPIFLHGALARSLRSSIHTNDKYADNISFALKYAPNVLNKNAPDCLDCLELQYKVDWPLNIIITDNCLTKYSKLFSYMLQLRRIVWVLKEVWYKLKGDAVIMKAGNSPQFRQLQLFRQEMQHFVKVMQGYISNQIIQVTWLEFQEALNQHVHNLDQLHRVHAEYLDMAIFRCLLNQKAEPVMKIIQNIFSIILKFRNQLISASWQKSSTTRETNHPNFNNMVNTYKIFKEYSSFLFTVVNKLGTRGYQPHLHELLLRLNFNNYYKD